jgi:hypothetical protein
MRPSHDDFDDLDYDFADSDAERQLMRERSHELRRLAGRRASGPGNRRGNDDYDYDDDDFDDDDYDEYEDYDDDEFDSYSGSRYK